MTDPTSIAIPEEIQTAIDNGAVIALSMSGGKDSQAMASSVTRYLKENDLPNRVLAIHADLGRAEWFDTDETLHRQIEELGLELHIVQRDKGDLLQRIQERAEKVGDEKVFWPSSAARYCTSDLKRGPIDKFLRKLGPLVISVEGIRAEESTTRAKKPCWEVRKQITNSKRDALTWRPIHFWMIEAVWTELGTSDQELEVRRAAFIAGDEASAFDGWPAHNAYVRGNERLSCSLCVLASKADLENGARHNPEYLAELVVLEERYGWTFRPGYSLVELAKRLQDEADDVDDEDEQDQPGQSRPANDRSSKMSNTTRPTATILFEAPHFNEVAYANIPGGWTIFPDNGLPKMCCDDLEDALQVASRFNFEVTVIEEDVVTEPTALPERLEADWTCTGKHSWRGIDMRTVEAITSERDNPDVELTMKDGSKVVRTGFPGEGNFDKASYLFAAAAGATTEPGDTVTIYQDPITRQKPEGDATLIRCLNPVDRDGLSRWEVRFAGESETFERTILAIQEEG